MKVLVLLGIVGFLATAYGLTIRSNGVPVLSLKGNGDAKESNAIGNLIAATIYNFVRNNLTDPQLLIDNITIPTYIEDSLITINGSVNASDIIFGGHHDLNITTALGTLLPLGGTFGFHIPNLRVSGDYHIEEEIITNLFPIPIYGDGPFTVDLKEIRVTTKVAMIVNLTGHLKITSLTYELDIYEIEGRFDGLFSDVDESGELNEAVNILFNSYATRLVNVFEANLHENITQVLIDVGNIVLADLTWDDLVG